MSHDETIPSNIIKEINDDNLIIGIDVIDRHINCLFDFMIYGHVKSLYNKGTTLTVTFPYVCTGIEFTGVLLPLLEL